jgi:hypothetical protein
VAKIPSAILSETVIHEEAVLCEAFQTGLSAPESSSPDNRAVVEMLTIYREVFYSEKRLAQYA